MGNARRIHDIPLADRPREKLERKGEGSLSDFELLEVIIGSGSKVANVGTIARHIMKLLRSGTESVTLETLTAIPGISIAHASKILASLELARRHLVRDITPLRSVQDILARLDGIRGKQQSTLCA